MFKEKARPPDTENATKLSALSALIGREESTATARGHLRRVALTRAETWTDSPQCLEDTATQL